MTTETRYFSEVVEDINKALAEMSGNDLADLANKLLSDDAEYTYNGDSAFTVNKKDD